jgi:membrane-bound lytic murein transglycosylase MltF
MKARASVGAVLLLFVAATARAELADVRKRSQLRVLVAESPRQFFGWKPGAAPGLEREVLQGFARLQRVDLAIVPMPSRAAMFGALAKGEGDLAAGALCAFAEGDVEYSAEVLPSRYVVVSRRPAPSVLTLDELRHRKLGLVKGTAGLGDTLDVIAMLEPPTQDWGDAAAVLAALKAGKVGAVVLRVEAAIPAAREDPDLLLGMYLGPRLSLAFATRKDDVQLRATLSEYIRNLRRSPAWNRLVLSYFGDAAADILKASR